MAMPLPAPVPMALDLSVDMRVVAFTAIVAVIATLAFGLAPALTTSRVDLVNALKGIGADTPRHGRLRSAFLIGQVAMSVLLLVIAGLAIRSVRNARGLDVGFESAGVVDRIDGPGNARLFAGERRTVPAHASSSVSSRRRGLPRPTRSISFL